MLLDIINACRSVAKGGRPPCLYECFDVCPLIEQTRGGVVGSCSWNANYFYLRANECFDKNED